MHTEQNNGNLGAVAVGISLVSLVVYYCASQGIREYIRFLTEGLQNTVQALF